MGWIERQLPKGDEIFLDHVGFFVDDIEAVGAAFNKLGFTTTPVNIHYNADSKGGTQKSGTANRLCTFKCGYIEVLGAVAETPLAHQLKSALKKYTGLHLIAFSHKDMAAQQQRLEDAGFDLQPAVRLRRPIQTPEGERTVRATVVRTKPGVMAEARVQMLTHETPELIWLPEYSQHPNAADALTDLMIVSENSKDKAGLYGRLTNNPYAKEGDLYTVSMPRGRMTFATPDIAETLLLNFSLPSLPYIAAVGIRSEDMEKTRIALNDNGVTPLLDNETLICVGPADGVGAYIIFHSAKVENIWRQLSQS